MQIAQKAGLQLGGDGHDLWMVRARLAELNSDIASAEGILIEQGKVEEAVEMYQTLHRWDDAIAVAETQGHPRAAEMKDEYFQVRSTRAQQLLLASHC